MIEALVDCRMRGKTESQYDIKMLMNQSLKLGSYDLLTKSRDELAVDGITKKEEVGIIYNQSNENINHCF